MRVVGSALGLSVRLYIHVISAVLDADDRYQRFGPRCLFVSKVCPAACGKVDPVPLH